VTLALHTIGGHVTLALHTIGGHVTLALHTIGGHVTLALHTLLPEPPPLDSSTCMTLCNRAWSWNELRSSLLGPACRVACPECYTPATAPHVRTYLVEDGCKPAQEHDWPHVVETVGLQVPPTVS
jgi:hypothetical protein